MPRVLRWLGDERGSISPVFVTLLTAVLLLFYAVLEREWFNYNLEMAIQTADFAAQVAGRAHRAYATLRVSRLQYYFEDYYICDQVDAKTNACTKGHWETRTHSRWSYPVKVVPVDQLLALEDNWISLFESQRATAYAPNWQFQGVQVLSQHLEYQEVAEEVARTTFISNWPGHASAEATVESVLPMSNGNAIEMVVNLRTKSLMGILPWQHQQLIYGRAVTVVPKVEQILR